jgi:hypothetical protein
MDSKKVTFEFRFNIFTLDRQILSQIYSKMKIIFILHSNFLLNVSWKSTEISECVCRLAEISVDWIWIEIISSYFQI